ncbi:MAG: IS110 family transposase [Candidatus Peregrinibacteria bacterium]|nr:IS110 family transposase [Candidatus Peregrinibacteria bacterium]
MSKNTEIVGIDISKSTFDVYIPEKGYSQYANTQQGFGQFKKELEHNSHCVMEFTGAYYYQLAVYLHDQKLSVSVVNPLVIKRFMQMKQQRNKTDKSDAKMISDYGYEQELTQWEPDPDYVKESKNLYSSLELYSKQSTACKNQLHSLKSRGLTTGFLVRSIKRQLKHLKAEMELLEQELEKIVKEHQGDLYARLKTIPGIGNKTAALLIVSTDGFKNFESNGQVSSFFGLAPTERTSGSSIRGKSRISKIGNKKVRNHLFLCSFTACKCNPQCSALYERIVNKGKSKKLALIAVANKLIKQAYGIAKSELAYDPNYRSVLVKR